MDTHEDDQPISDSEIENDRYVLAQQFLFSGYQIIAGLSGFVTIVLLFVKGFGWYWESLYPVLTLILGVPVLLCLPAGLVAAIFRPARGVAGLLLLLSVLGFFSANWLQALGYAYLYAGKVWMIIGFLLAGVGVFGIAFIGALIQGEYYNAMMIAVTLIICWLFFIFSSALVMGSAVRRIKQSRADEFALEEVRLPPPPTFESDSDEP